MSLRQLIFYFVCVVTWFVLMPACVALGVIALLAYAVFSEVSELFAGGANAVDSSKAREIARRVCLGN